MIEKDNKVKRFDLTKEQMKTELKLCGSSAHGNGGGFAIRMKHGDQQWERWSQKYLSTAKTPDILF